MSRAPSHLAIALASGAAAAVLVAAGWLAGGPAPAFAQREIAATSVRADDLSVTSISGLHPDRVTGTELRFSRGWCADSAGEHRIMFRSTVTVSLERIGANGVDSADSRAAGELYPYVIGSSKTGEAAIVLSSRIVYRDVVKPPGYDVIRKLPWGFVLVDGRIPAFHFSGWGNAFTRLTEAGTTPQWQVLARGVARDGWTVISLRGLIPDNARMAYVVVKADNTGGARPGSAYLRVGPVQGDGVQLGELARGQVVYLSLHHRVTSRRELYFRTTGDVTLDIWVLGYTNTEPS